MDIKFPSWRIKQTQGEFPYNERLIVCDYCGHARWTSHLVVPVALCRNRDAHPNKQNAKMREATIEEYGLGRLSLKEEKEAIDVDVEHHFNGQF
jgi:hypothetical protein